ncbi:MAG: hypothetical protein II942_00775 [Alphaproteobacteria bacterium]|nr:hypothetical protein [Alphaproteobacteria bacterium]
MRIGLTDYYTTKKHIYAHDPETNRIRPQSVPAYVLSVYNKPHSYIYELCREMRTYGIGTQYKCYIDDDLELPHILILQPTAVERLEKLFKQQGIDLPADRFEKRTDWDEVVDFERKRAKGVFQPVVRNKRTIWQKISKCLGR